MATAIEQRIRLEKVIVRKAVKALLAAGYSVEVWNGGDSPEVKATTDYRAIDKGLFLTDEDTLTACKDGARSAFVLCVYGNDGWDVLADHSVSLEAVLAPVYAYADTKEVR